MYFAAMLRAAILLCCAALSTQAQNDPLGVAEHPIRFTAIAGTPRVTDATSTHEVSLRAAIPAGWKLYSLTQPAGGPVPTSIQALEPFSLRGTIGAPKPEKYHDRNFNIFSEIYHDSVVFRVRIAGPKTTSAAQLVVTYQTCTERYCLPPRADTIAVMLAVQNALVATSDPSDTLQTVTNAPALATPRREGTREFKPPTDFRGLVQFIWLAITMGLLSILTPCILPMVPITVSFFGGTDDRARPRAALAHVAGMVAVLVAIGTAFSLIFGAGGVVRLASSPLANAGIALLFTVFALNLFGLFEIGFPSSVLTRLSTRPGNSRNSAAMLMGGVFALTSFTCTAPFVGTLLVLATQGTWRWPLIGLTVYALAFAVPFLILALSPGILARLPRPGEWMLTLKRVVAVIELAMAVKFLSNADLVLQTGLLQRRTILVLWICAAFGVVAACIHGLFATRGAQRRWAVLVFNLLVSCVAVLGAARMFSGLRGHPLGELEAYLPPRTSRASVASIDGLSWRLNDLGGAVEQARREGKLVFVDFTGYTCTNCRWMEANMFPLSEVRTALDRYVLVRLFTDGAGEPYASQQRFQQSRFRTIALPFYAIIRPDSSAASTFLGMTRERDEFVKFLRAGAPEL